MVYFATQAKNICEEKANHRYYKLYKKYVRQINRNLTWLVARGKTRYEMGTENVDGYEVLCQIANELAGYGYKTNVFTRHRKVKNSEEPREIYCLELKWSDV